MVLAAPLRLLDTHQDHTPTTAKVDMWWLQIPRIPLGSRSIQALRVMLGGTRLHMLPHSSSGTRGSSLHKTTMEILSVRLILRRGQEPELVLRRLISPRYEYLQVLR